MQIPVLVEKVGKNGYRARGGAPFALSATGATRADAVAKLQQKLKAKLRAGAVVVPVEIDSAEHPLAEFVGMFKDDPHIKDWKKSMAEYRRAVDAEPDLP